MRRQTNSNTDAAGSAKLKKKRYENCKIRTYNNGVFQPGEAASMGTEFKLIYDTYIREAEGWRYIGRCYPGETEVAEEFIIQ